MMRPTTVAAAFALLLLASTASAWYKEECGACPLDNDCLCSACALNAVELGAAADFVVLAGSGVTTGAGTCAIIGDIGVSPGISVTGMVPAHLDMITGNIQIANDASAAGQGNLTIAYNTAAGLTLCPIVLVDDSNLGGLTLYPGLYKSAKGLQITGSDLTLEGGADDVFIFQMGETFLITTGMKITLAGGAQAKNIFWQVGSSATLQANTVMQGTIMAMETITAASGCTVNGRLLARNAAVTMQTATFTRPSA
jgi:hypothetical protein